MKMIKKKILPKENCCGKPVNRSGNRNIVKKIMRKKLN